MLRLLQNTLLGLSLMGLGPVAGELAAQGGPPVEIQTPSLPPATVGVPYAAFLMGNHGRPLYEFSVVSGALPPGLTLFTQEQKVDVMIAGIPKVAGSFPVGGEAAAGTVGVWVE